MEVLPSKISNLLHYHSANFPYKIPRRVIGMVRFELTTFALSARHSTTELHSIKVGVDINNLPVSVFGLKNLSPTNRSFITEEVNLRDHKGQAGTPGIEPRPHVLQTYVPTNLHHVPIWGIRRFPSRICRI